MKKLSLLIAVSLLASTFAALPALANNYRLTQQQQPPKFGSDEERQAYEAWFSEKDPAKKFALAKEFAQKFPQSNFIKYIEGNILSTLGTNFQTALQAFYQGPDASKIEKLITAGDEYLAKQPGQVYILTQVALATGYGVLGGFYKDIDKSHSYADKALKLLENPTPPEGFKPDDYAKLRAEGLARLNQYKGLYYLRQATPDPEQAIVYLTKAAEHKDWSTAKDPNTYALRAEANSIIYDKLSAEYRAMTDKSTDAAKAMLTKIDPVVDKMIDDYARLVALFNKPDTKQQHEAAKGRLEDFWKYRHEGKLEGMAEYVKRYEADPTAPPPPSTASTSTPPASQPSGGNKPNGRPKGR